MLLNRCVKSEMCVTLQSSPKNQQSAVLNPQFSPQSQQLQKFASSSKPQSLQQHLHIGAQTKPEFNSTNAFEQPEETRENLFFRLGISSGLHTPKHLSAMQKTQVFHFKRQRSPHIQTYSTLKLAGGPSSAMNNNKDAKSFKTGLKSRRATLGPLKVSG